MAISKGLSGLFGLSPYQQQNTANNILQASQAAQSAAQAAKIQLQAAQAAQTWGTLQQDLVGDTPKVEELSDGAMEANISELVDMWTIKFGDRWVKENEINGDRFWHLVLIRLYGVDKIEKHQLFNSFTNVYRIIR